MNEPDDDRGVTDETLAMMTQDQVVARIRQQIPDWNPTGPATKETNEWEPQQEQQQEIEPETSAPTTMPWPKWTNGDFYVVTHGADFSISVGEFQNRLHNVARRKGLFVLTKTVSDVTIEFQFFKTRAERERQKYLDSLPPGEQ